MEPALSRDLNQARAAYQVGDAEQSRLAHLAKAHAQRETEHKKAGGAVITSLVFGGLDGIVTTFAVLLAAAAQQLPIATLLILTFANLVGDAVGMAVGDWLSSVAEEALEDKQRDQMRQDIDNNLVEEKSRLVDRYVERGLPRDDAQEIVELLLENREGFVAQACVYKLGILPKDAGGSSPLKDGIVTFLSFAICSAVPMLAYIFSFRYTSLASLDYLFWISCALFVVTLFALGAVKGVITNSSWWLSGLITLAQGTVTSVGAYFISFAFERIH